MTTARDIIKSIHRKIGILGQGSTLNASEFSDTLEAINDMLAVWSVDGALIYTETRETFTLTGSMSYTIGAGADFDTTLPNDITSAFVTENGYDTPLSIVDVRDYDTLADKDQTGTPQRLYFDGNYPTAKIYLWPVNITAATITLTTQKPLTGFASLDTVYALPPEYKRAIIYNGALEVAPEHDEEPSNQVKITAKSTLNLIKSQNQKNNKGALRTDASFMHGGRYDIRKGRYV